MLGNSVAVMQMPNDGEPRSDVYAGVMANRLAAEGIPVTTALEGRWFDFVVRGRRQYEQRVRSHLPDVLVVQYGLNEAQPWIVPVWLIRHLLRQDAAVSRSARWYRRVIGKRAWIGVRRLRRWASPRVGMRTWQTTPRRFRGHLRALVHGANQETGALVLVLDLNDSGDRLEHFMPGQAARHAVFQQVIAEVVESCASPSVRLVRSSEVCRRIGPTALPDGMHYSPEAHAAIGDLLADEVIAYLRDEGRLHR